MSFITAARALLAVAFLAAAPAALAQTGPGAQPVNPTALSVQERQLLQQLNPGNPTLSGRVSIPDGRAANLVQPQGRDWRQFHQVTLPRLTAIVILGTIVLLGVFYAVRGPMRLSSGLSGTKITRFAFIDRFAHWLSASTFIVLALTGLNITVGRWVLLPVIGPDAFTTVSQYGKFLHNYLSWAFMAGVILMFLLWVKDNIPSKLDWEWVRVGGGFFGKQHPRADRFNAGQKGIFWSVIIGGALLTVSGIFMLFPAEGARAVTTNQLWISVHAIVAVILIAVMIGHIYIGSIGMQGAYDAMGSGQVDLAWAREHHAIWAERQLAKERGAPPPGRAVPAE
jgi:formate dehydrogenase subunit gamma